LSATGAGQGYQKRIYVYFNSGNNTQDSVFLDKNCKSDFSDIRFTSSDGFTRLNYWLESKVDEQFAIFWVKVNQSLDNSGFIYLYYGNNDAQSESDGLNTFLFFDDFNGESIDGSKWNVRYWANPYYGTGTASYSIANSKLVLSSPAYSYRQIQVNSKVPLGTSAMHTSLRPYPLQQLYFVTAWGRIQNEPSSYDQRSKGQLNGVGSTWYVDDYNNHYFARRNSSNQETSADIVDQQRVYWEKYIKNVRLEEGYDQESEGTFLTNVPDAFLRPAFLCGCTVGSAYGQTNLEVDWVFLRKYVYPEPQSNYFGNEETLVASGYTHVLGKDAKLSGVGSKQTIIQSSADPIISVESNFSDLSKSALIENLVIFGTGENTAIRLQDVSGCQIRNVTIGNCGVGVDLYATADGRCDSNCIEHLRLLYNNTGIRFRCDSYPTSFNYNVLDDIGISLDGVGNCGISIEDENDGSILNDSIIRAMLWAKASGTVCLTVYGAIKRGLINLRCEGFVGRTTGVKLCSTGVSNNHSFYLSHGGLSQDIDDGGGLYSHDILSVSDDI
jgi:hypothetical protein